MKKFIQKDEKDPLRKHKGWSNQVVLDVFEGQMKKKMWQEIEINQAEK